MPLTHEVLRDREAGEEAKLTRAGMETAPPQEPVLVGQGSGR
jgi:hypothetical protein